MPLCRVRRGDLLANEDFVAHPLDPPASDRIQRGCAQRLATAQAEAGVMPWTTQRIAGHQAFREGPVVMRAIGAYREEFVAAPRQDHVFVVDTPDEHPAIRKAAERNAALQIRFRSALRICHEILPARSMHEISIGRITGSRTIASSTYILPLAPGLRHERGPAAEPGSRRFQLRAEANQRRLVAETPDQLHGKRQSAGTLAQRQHESGLARE